MPPAGKVRFGKVTLSTGITLAYAEQGDSSGEVVLFLHGYTDSWYSFSRVLALLPAPYHAYALDQRGHGNSEKPHSAYTQDEFAGDAIAFMHALRIDQATLVGHSMGSFVAQQIAIRCPDRVTRLILIGSAPSLVKNRNVLELQRAVLALTDPIARQFVYEFQSGGIASPVPVEFLEAIVAESLKAPAYVWRAALAGLLAEERGGPLDRIRAPTLIVWGERDTVFTYDEQIALSKRIPHATLKIYEGTGHNLQWERPNEFVRDLEAFMQGTGKRV